MSVRHHIAPRIAPSIAIVCAAVLGCAKPSTTLPVATADQTPRDAMLLVCDAPTRATDDIRQGISKSDAIAAHLTDGVGNNDVLITVEGWKTSGVALGELDGLLRQARITSCALRDSLR
jgi:hypothetical protein